MSKNDVRRCVCGEPAIGHDVKDCLLFGPQAVKRAEEWWANKIDEDRILITERHERPPGGWPFVPVFSGHRNPQMAETFGGQVPVSKLEDQQ